MKKLKFPAVIFLSVVGLTALHISHGLFNRYNFFTAYWDKWTAEERIIIYGEPLASDSLKSALAPCLGFSYERREDCTVTQPFVNGVKDYNRVMGHAINKKLGENWNDRLEKEIAALKK